MDHLPYLKDCWGIPKCI